MYEPHKILLLEDSKTDADLIQRLLKKEFSECTFSLAMDEKDYRQAIKSFKPEVILSDHALPQFNSSKALTIAQEELPGVPFILVTGTASEEFAAGIILQGADDYILKDRMARLPAAIKAALKQKKTEAEKKEAFNTLRKSEEKYRTILERVSDAFVALDKDWRYIYVNKKASEMIRRLPEELIGKTPWDLFPEMVNTPFYHAINKAMKKRKYVYLEEYYEPYGIWIETQVYPSPEGLSVFFKDTTERKEAEEKLISSEEKYRTLFYKNPLPGWIFDPNTLRFLDVNEAAIKHYGYSKDEFLAMTIRDIRPKEEIPDLLSDIKKIGASKNSRTGTWNHLKKNGELILVETTAHSITFNHTKARLVVINDVTQKIKDQVQLKHSEERLREAQAISHLGNWEIDFNANEYFWSDETYKILGFHKGKDIPSMELFLSRIHPKERLAAHAYINETINRATDAKIYFRFIKKKVEVRYAYSEWHFELDNEGKAVRLFGILQDITEQKKAENKLNELERKIAEQKIEEQKRVARAIIKAQEKERNFLGQELHDNINQLLATVKIYLSSGMSQHDEFNKFLGKPMEILELAMEEIRLLCQKLVTPAKDINLETLISDLAGRLENISSVKTQVSIGANPGKIPDDIKLNIYRLIQEQVNNIYKYAEAKKVSISIKVAGSEVLVKTQDDGKGFDIHAKRKGVGINNMLNRVKTFNGKMEIISEPGKGCIIKISIPI